MNKLLVSVLIVFAASANAALVLDRSRLVLNEGERSVSINVDNRNKNDPYLAQAWLEDINEVKSNHYITALPPLQRVEGGGKTKVRLQALPNITTLPQDRESVLFFNLREIPPKSDKPNVFSLGRVRISTLRNENETFSQLNSITYIGVFLRLVTYSHLP